MPVIMNVLSIPIIVDKTCKKNSFIMNACDLSFLWTIVKNKPMSLYDLQKQKFDFPMSRAKLTIPKGNIDDYVSEIGKLKTHRYPFISKVVNRLETKGLVSTYMESTGIRPRRIVSPTFKGIIYFLQNESPYEDKAWKGISKSFDDHQSTLGVLNDAIGFFRNLSVTPGLITRTIWDTIWEFYGLRKVKFTINHLEKSFEGYLENSNRFLEKRTQYMNPNFHKNPQIVDCLKKEEGIKYRNAYIAYLAMNDIEVLSVANNSNLRDYALILISEIELAEFEKREVGSNFLFDGERPLEFFSEKSDLQSYFVGMFIRNLLCGSIEKVADAKAENKHDYEIKELD